MKKYKILIADDEYYIRIRIKKIINWDKLPIELVGEAENGKQVIEFLKQDIDIVLLDIKMPGLTGIDVAEYINANNLATKVIILSGFDDFEYAQKCIKFSVVDYLLKPVAQDTLNDAISKTITIIDKASKDKGPFFEDEQLKELLHLKAMGNKSFAEDYVEKYIGVNYKFSQFIGIFAFNNLRAKTDELCHVWGGTKAEFQVVNASSNTACIQFFYLSEESALQADFLAERVKGDKMAISMGGIFSLTDDWYPEMLIVKNLLLMRYFYGIGKVYSQETLSEEHYTKKLLELRYQIIASVNKGSFDFFKAKLLTAKKEICDGKSAVVLKLFVGEIAHTFGLLFPAQQSGENNIADKILQKLNEFYELDNLFEFILDFFKENILSANSQPHDVVIAEKIADYIDENFENPQINVATISEIMGITASYAGIIFKRINSLSINQYLNNVRIENACRIMKDENLKISDIGIHVGYNDAFYFSRKFKEIVGVSPKEYQKSLF